MKGSKKADWKGTWTADRKTIPVFLCCLIAILVIGYLGGIFIPTGAVSPIMLIEITEVMPDNEDAYPMENGDYLPWIEILNRSNTAVDLSQWKMSSDFDVRGAVAISNSELGAGERTVIFLPKEADTAGKPAIRPGKGNSELFVFDDRGRVLEKLDIPPVDTNTSLIRDPDSGEWTETKFYSPGEKNDMDGYHTVLGKLSAAETVRINEVVASNRDSLKDSAGNTQDWFELYVPGNEPVDLTGWSVTDEICHRRKWVFPEGTGIGAGEYMIIHAGRYPSEGLNVGFPLSKENGQLYLLDAYGRCVSSAEWKKLDRDESLSRTEGPAMTTEYMATPGSTNCTTLAVDAEAEEKDRLAKLQSSNAHEIYINEVACSVTGGSDWVELYNAGNAAMDIGGWWLSDKKNEPKRWAFPEGTRIQPNGYLVVRLNGSDNEILPNGSRGLTANFALDLAKSREDSINIILSDADGVFVDRIRMKEQRKNVSYGRAEGYETYRFFSDMTPGSRNSANSYAACAMEPEFSPNDGAQAEKSFEVAITSNAGAEIHYTTDGSEPTEKSPRYSGPMSINSAVILRARAFGPDMLSSETVTRTFIPNHPTSLRVVCVSGNSSELIGSDGTLKTGNRTPQEVNVEIYDYDGTLMINQRCEMKVSGKQSRVKFAQKAFKLLAKKSIGSGKFKARLFNNRDYEEYDSIVMRASGQDVFSTHMRDSVLTSLAASTEVMYQETELACVFINGKYWGMYNMRENLNEDSVTQFEGWTCDPESIDVLQGSGASRSQGSKETFNDMCSFVKSNSLKDDANIEKLREYLDIENYLDYVCLSVYLDHQDAGNVMMYHAGEEDGLWRWALFDQDLSFHGDRNTIGMWLEGSSFGVITETDNTIFRKLMQNANMREYFLTRMGELLAGPFSARNVQGKILERYERIKDEMVFSCERWGVSYEGFQKQTAKLYRYAGKRTSKLIGYFKKEFSLNDEQMRKYFGAAIDNEAAYAAMNGASDESEEDEDEDEATEN